jgi:sirohydrochlorin ferrochelatase
VVDPPTPTDKGRSVTDDRATTALPDRDPALLLIAHGTRDPAGATEMATLCEHVRARVDAPVGAAWLEEFADPDAVTAATDLIDVARARIDAVSDADAREDEVLVVTGAGSSDPDANGDLAKAARTLAELTGHRWAEIAYAGVTWPRADALFERLRRAGARRIVRFSWSLLAGLLERRVDGWASDAADGDLEIRDAGRFGPDPLVADVVVDRYREAIMGDPRMNCDLCAYRVPLPGFENRVGAPSAGGVGTAVHPSAAGALSSPAPD